MKVMLDSSPFGSATRTRALLALSLLTDSYARQLARVLFPRCNGRSGASSGMDWSPPGPWAGPACFGWTLGTSPRWSCSEVHMERSHLDDQTLLRPCRSGNCPRGQLARPPSPWSRNPLARPPSDWLRGQLSRLARGARGSLEGAVRSHCAARGDLLDLRLPPSPHRAALPIRL